MINDIKALCDKYGDEFNWIPVTGNGEALVSELSRELTADHPLYNLPLRPLAKCESGDDVLFCIDCQSDKRCFIVHLTYSDNNPPPFPLYQAFVCFEGVVNHIENKFKKESL